MRSDAFLGMTISVTKGERPVNTELKNEVKAIIAGKEPALA